MPPLDPQAFGQGGVFALAHQSIGPFPRAPGLTGNDRPPALLALAIDPDDHRVLTGREPDVFRCPSACMSINDIAAELFRSPKTIGRHAESIHRKMGYTNRAELVLDVAECGLGDFTTDE